MEFMPADGIRVHQPARKAQLWKRLHPVTMKNAARRNALGRFCQRFNIVHRARLVVYLHYGYQPCIRPHGRLQCFRV